MFYFFVTNLGRGSWTATYTSMWHRESCNLPNWAYLFWCFGHMSYSHPSLDQVPTVCLWCFQGLAVSLRAPLMWRFCGCRFLADIHWTCPAGCVPQTEACSSNVTQLSAFTDLLIFNCNPPFHFCFFAGLSSLLANSLFQPPILVKWRMGSSLGDKKAARQHLCSLCVNGLASNRSMAASCPRTLKDMAWLVTGHDGLLSLT